MISESGRLRGLPSLQSTSPAGRSGCRRFRVRVWPSPSPSGASERASGRTRRPPALWSARPVGSVAFRRFHQRVRSDSSPSGASTSASGRIHRLQALPPARPAGAIFEVLKRVLQQTDEGSAFQAVMAMQQGRVVDLSQPLALRAAAISLQLKLPMADSIVLATARSYAPPDGLRTLTSRGSTACGISRSPSDIEGGARVASVGVHVRCYDIGVKSQEATAAMGQDPAGFDPEAIDHDDSLILWMLGLSPTKRLAVAQGFVDSVRVLRSGRRASVSRHPRSPDPT